MTFLNLYIHSYLCLTFGGVLYLAEAAFRQHCLKEYKAKCI